MERRLPLAAALAALVVLSGCSALPPLEDGFDPGADGVDGADYRVTVVGVLDGDTVEIRYANGTVETARLIGIDTPEVHVPVDPPEFGVVNTTAGRACLRAAGHDATRYSTRRLLGERVGISFDPNLDRRGYYGRLLVYVVTEEGTHNYDLVATGHARVYESDFVERDRYDAAAAAARANATGVWQCASDADGAYGGTATATDGATVTATDGGTAVDGPLRVVDVTADPEGADGEHLNEETVTLENTDDESLSLEGWTLADAAGHTYAFDSFSLGPGERVTVHTGSGTDTATDRYWGAGSPLWNNDGDTVIVRDADGTVVVRYEYD